MDAVADEAMSTKAEKWTYRSWRNVLMDIGEGRMAPVLSQSIPFTKADDVEKAIELVSQGEVEREEERRWRV